jgi:hypothetical protein
MLKKLQILHCYYIYNYTYVEYNNINRTYLLIPYLIPPVLYHVTSVIHTVHHPLLSAPPPSPSTLYAYPEGDLLTYLLYTIDYLVGFR